MNDEKAKKLLENLKEDFQVAWLMYEKQQYKTTEEAYIAKGQYIECTGLVWIVLHILLDYDDEEIYNTKTEWKKEALKYWNTLEEVKNHE